MLAALGFVVAWFIGGVLGADLLAKLWPGPPVRESGSGNPGASNALRVRGKLFALLVLLWDAAKAVLVLLVLAPLVQKQGGSMSPESYSALLGLAAVAGHIWPPLSGFKGGKGVATALGVIAVLLPALLPWVLGVWLIVFLTTGYSGLASALAALVLPLWAISTGDVESGKALMAFCMMLTALVLGAHRQNLQRLVRGEENQFVFPWQKSTDEK
ncbi:MAG: glycerol-3-phosphate 1-O-acyltransferase PlsY [Gammaproteobacteria bacterium]|nr:glycerol-3-phosphate 1-O-acyltransferase PlsY [Gammaproteobacteria bacterium]